MGEREKFLKFIDDIKLREGFALDKEFADLFNIAPSNLAVYKSTRNIPKSWKLWYCKRYDITLNQLEDFLNDRSQKVENSDIIQNQKKLLEYQEKDIERLKQELKDYKDKERFLGLPKLYEECVPDFRSRVQLRNITSFKSIERNIQSVENPENLANKLDIDVEVLKKEYFSIGNWHISIKHPIDKLVHEQSLDELKSVTKEIPNQNKIYKFTFGYIYLTFDIMYVYKDKSVFTRSFSKAKWSTKPTVETKNTILTFNS